MSVDQRFGKYGVCLADTQVSARYASTAWPYEVEILLHILASAENPNVVLLFFSVLTSNKHNLSSMLTVGFWPSLMVQAGLPVRLSTSILLLP